MQTEPSMTWNITLLVVHLLYLVGVILLYRSAPCWMQKVSLFGLGIAMALLAFGFGAASLALWWNWQVILLALAIEHLAVMVYIFRLIYQTRIEWKPSSDHSHSL